MTKIDINYVKKLFECVEENEEISVPTDIDIKGYDETRKNLNRFLNMIITYADKENIPESIGEENYSDDRFYYIISYNGNALEIGSYYDSNEVYANKIEECDSKNIIDCNKLFKVKTKKLLLDKSNTKKEEK